MQELEPQRSDSISVTRIYFCSHNWMIQQAKQQSDQTTYCQDFGRAQRTLTASNEGII